MERIGVRELRQHASRYLARVAQGATIQVTDRGRPLALLVPVPADDWEALVTSGRVRPPSDGSDVADDTPGDFGVEASRRLTLMREHER